MTRPVSGGDREDALRRHGGEELLDTGRKGN